MTALITDKQVNKKANQASKQALNDANVVQKMHWAFWLGVTFFIAVIVAVLSSSWYLSKQMVIENNMPIATLSIEGEIHYTQRQDVIKSLEDVDLSNFFQVNVNIVQQQIAQLPWVYSASVRKQWPDELKIYIVDQTPIAIWNGDFLMNQYGDVFQANINKLTAPVPQFFGPEGSENIALENFINFNKLLKFSGLTIDELMLSERFAWQLTLSDGVLLNLGREERFERISRFMDLYPQINKNKQADQQVDYIDLRYDTGAAVGWKPVNVPKAAIKQGSSTVKKALVQQKNANDLFDQQALLPKELTLYV
jgi:cell division protein FtsQ